MKIIFVSNFYNHHQSMFSAEMHSLTEGRYCFIATEDMPEEQRNLGYGKEAVPHYVLYAHKSNKECECCQKHIIDADIVITGSAPEYLIRNRIKAGKLTFRYSERPLKKDFQPLKYLPRLLLWHARSPMWKPIYMLCASAYTAVDYAKFGLFLGRCYKWGYFPETKRYDVDALMEGKRHGKTALLWAGRFIDWKHPEYAIKAAERLREDGYDFELNMIGTGVMENEIKAMIAERNLEDCVHVLGSMPPEDVRKHMEAANIFLFTSDRQEGWGAVLNESMNSGCAVVACRAIGSVPFLLKDGENGAIYQEGDFDGFCERVRMLIDHPELQEAYGRAAYKTITGLWNAEVAAERLIRLAECLQNGEDTPFEDGPCSRAEIYTNFDEL